MERIPAILASRDRCQAGPTAPARGLCMQWIRYDLTSPPKFLPRADAASSELPTITEDEEGDLADLDS